MLIVCPEGGLGNRIRAFASALALQHQYGCDLKCIWQCQQQVLNAPFLSLFEPIQGVFIDSTFKNLTTFRPVLSRYRWRRSWLQGLNYLQGVDRYLYEDSSHPGAIADALPDASRFINSGLVLIHTWQAFADFTSQLSRFQPIPSILARVDSITSCFDPNVVGVHIRRGDHSTSRQSSPIEGFQVWIDAHLQQHPSARFFLCSDDDEIYIYFSQIYGTRILAPHRLLSRDSVEGVKHAVVDLYSLSRTSQIVGSYHSSFSELAALLGHIPLHTIHRDSSFFTPNYASSSGSSSSGLVPHGR
jgi:hypothetical protein